MRNLFISDLHLMDARADTAAAFEAFLTREAQNADTLYVLGDLFEVWLGDDHETAFNERIKTALARVPCRKYLMHGNRDFLLGKQFCADTGMDLLDDPTTLEIGGTTWLLLHGDTLCTRDTAYLEARSMLRNPAFQAEFLGRSLQERAEFAASVRAESSAHTSTMQMDIMDVTPAEVDQVLRASRLTHMIHGHTHRPQVHNFELGTGESAVRIVLGDWDTHGWCLDVIDAKPELVSFEIA